MAKLSFLLLLVVAIVITVVSSQSNCSNKKYPVSAGQYWVDNPGCTRGKWYNAPNNFRCSCWSFCGYRCRPMPPSLRGGTPTQNNCANKKPPSNYGSWHENPGCPHGPYFNQANGKRCSCWAFCGYRCRYEPSQG